MKFKAFVVTSRRILPTFPLDFSYVLCLLSVPPIRAKIVREWSFFAAGQAYNVSCQVLGSRPPAVTAIYVGPSQLREVNYHVSSVTECTNNKQRI